jgi:signal transduction histidine kinase/CheY-like chemotaxis protein
VGRVPASRDDLERKVQELTLELHQTKRERKRAIASLMWELRVNATLSQMEHSLIAYSLGIDDIAAKALKYARDLTGSGHGFIAEIDQASGDLIAHTLTDMMEGECGIGDEERKIVFPRGKDGRYPSLWGHSLNSGQPFFTNSPRSHETAAGTPEGHVAVESFLAFPVHFRDQLVGLIALANAPDGYTARDVKTVGQLAELYALAVHRCRSERAQAQLTEELRHSQKMEAIGTLAGGIAHDFNNILTPIMAHVDCMLVALPGESPLQEDIVEVKKAVARAKRLVGQILSFSRRREEKRQAVDFSEIVGESMDLLRASIPTTVEIREEIDRSSGHTLADPTQLHQILLNLCSNAEHAMRGGGVLTIGIDHARIDEDTVDSPAGLAAGSYVHLTVSDTGHGMDDETMRRLFEPYFTTKDAGEGTGLGLSIVHGIVRALGGAVTVRSAPGEGSRFEVYLPRSPAERSGDGDREEEAPRGTERVLFIDDEIPNVRVGEKILTRLGYRVTPMTSCVAAFELFSEDPHAYDLVLTDQTLPGMTGDALVKKLLAVRPDLPTIICTGNTLRIDAEKAKAVGAKSLLLKPFGIAKLSSAVRAALDSSASGGDRLQ